MISTERLAAAKALGITARSLGDWRKLPGFPDCSAGYDIKAIQKWREDHQKKGSAADEQIAAINKALKWEKLQELKKKNHLLDLERDAEEGKLLPRRTYELFVASLLSGIGDWCEQIPALVEAELPAKYGKKARARLEEEFKRMREQLAEDLKRTPT